MTASPDTPIGPTVMTVAVAGSAPWAFERREDGAVNIAADVTSGAPVRELLIPAEHWASIVACVSWAGDTDERYRKAHRFHHGDDPAGHADDGDASESGDDQ